MVLDVCPERRIRHLWPETCEQLRDSERPVELESHTESPGLWRAKARDAERRVVMLS